MPWLLIVATAGVVLGVVLLAYSAVQTERLPNWAGAALVGGVFVATVGRALPGAAWFGGALIWEAPTGSDSGRRRCNR